MTSTLVCPRSGRCLVLALDGIGDLVLRQPLLTGLADAGYEVHVLVQASYEALLSLLDRRLRGIPAPLRWTEAPAVEVARALLDRLRQLDPALVVSAQFDPVRYVDWILRALPAAFSVGFHGGSWQEVAGAALVAPRLRLGAPRPLDLAVSCEAPLAEAEKGRRLLGELVGGAASSDPPRIRLPPSDRAAAEAVLRSLGLAPGYLVCFPAGTKNVTIKAWPADRFARLAAWATRERGVSTLVLGHESEAGVVEAVADAARAQGADVRSWRAGDGDLATTVGLLARARLYLGNDTGAMHLAAAAGVPVVAIFGGGHWPRFLPVSSRGAVHTRKLVCFGCGWRDCFFGDGPCVNRVEEAAVRASVAHLLEGADGFEVHDDTLPLTEADQDRAVG
jgi:ADP-heptose:LPS heptosyltransferase